MRIIRPITIYRRLRQSFFLVTASLLAIMACLFPIISTLPVSAAGQLTTRSLSIDSGVPSKTGVSYTYTFTVAATSTLQSMKFQACTSPVGTCSAPAGLTFAGATFGSQSGFQGAVNFAVDNTGANNCTPAVNILCANRTSATNQTATSRSITFGTITNPSTPNVAFFVRITTYSNNAYTVGNIQDQGTTASAVVQTLTTAAEVAEVLNFCVGNTTLDVANTTGSLPTSCAGVTGTSLDLGVLSTAAVNVSPVSAANNGDANNGLVMLRTNASGGATVAYDAIQDGTGSFHQGALRIQGQTCTNDAIPSTSTTDKCINSKGTTQGTLTNGTEQFGMTIAAVTCDSTTSYTCTFAGGTYNLIRNANYDGTGANTYPATDVDQIGGTTAAGYAWDETGTIQTIASSSTYVDDEALILKFAATSNLITPFGSYSVKTDFIAVPTY